MEASLSPQLSQVLSPMPTEVRSVVLLTRQAAAALGRLLMGTMLMGAKAGTGEVLQVRRHSRALTRKSPALTSTHPP